MNDEQYEAYSEEFYEIVSRHLNSLMDRLAWLRDKYSLDNETIDEDLYYNVHAAYRLTQAWTLYTNNEKENN